ncbi:hypothetical protein Sjap_013505 [Stephania japonica]|uniref:Uncharacterized protein n=1 Tax=Stephania japonica TaxID=461633 RepID=A0AAP0IZT7_9MAGN
MKNHTWRHQGRHEEQFLMARATLSRAVAQCPGHVVGDALGNLSSTLAKLPSALLFLGEQYFVFPKTGSTLSNFASALPVSKPRILEGILVFRMWKDEVGDMVVGGNEVGDVTVGRDEVGDVTVGVNDVGSVLVGANDVGDRTNQGPIPSPDAEYEQGDVNMVHVGDVTLKGKDVDDAIAVVLSYIISSPPLMTAEFTQMLEHHFHVFQVMMETRFDSLEKVV